MWLKMGKTNNKNINYNFLEKNSSLKKNTFQERILISDLSYHTVKNGKILFSDNVKSNGVYDENNKFYDLSYYHELLDHVEIFPEGIPISSSIERVIYIGTLNKMYGHLITDGLKKLWFLKSDYAKKIIEESNFKICYSADWDSPPQYAIDVFKLAGYDLTSFIQIKGCVSASEIIIPENSLVHTGAQGRFIYTQYIDTINHIISQLPINQNLTYEKLYFTRSALNSGRDFNELEVEEIFRTHGYMIVSPEKYSVIDQLSMLQNCKQFATTYGSLSHEILFCKENTDITILTKSDYVNDYQNVIDQIRPMNITYVKAHHSWRKASYLGPFYIAVTKQLRTYMKISGYRKCVFFKIEFMKYWCAILKIYWKRFQGVLKIHEKLTK